MHKQRGLLGSALGKGQELSLDFSKTLAGEQSQAAPHGQEWGGYTYGRAACFCALLTQVQKKKMLLADKSIGSQVLLLSVGFAKQTDNKCKDSLQTQHSSNCEPLLPFHFKRSIIASKFRLGYRFFPTESKGKVHSWPRLQCVQNQPALEENQILVLRSQRRTRGQLLRSCSVTPKHQGELSSSSMSWALGPREPPGHLTWARCHPCS